jgi:hypothetical protein
MSRGGQILCDVLKSLPQKLDYTPINLDELSPTIRLQVGSREHPPTI